jgi:hypothetical protein
MSHKSHSKIPIVKNTDTSIPGKWEKRAREGGKEEETCVVFQRKKGLASRRSSQWSRMQSLEMAIMGGEGREGGEEGGSLLGGGREDMGGFGVIGNLPFEKACRSALNALPSSTPPVPSYRAATVAYIQYKSSSCPRGMR